MNVCYSTTIIGSAHIKKGTVCQDANKHVTLKNGWILGVIADGVGSAKYSDKASNIAVEAIIEFFINQENLEWNIELIDNLLPNSYLEAQKRIEDFALSKNHDFFDYDTTLDVVIYNGQEMVYGHSGDGGIVGLTVDGDYIAITKPQKGDDGTTVIPLRSGREFWQFGRSKHDYASILLATDGIYDTFFPYLLKGQPNEIYIPLIRFFMDNNILQCNEKNLEDIKKAKEEFLTSETWNSITDDKTLMVMLNLDKTPKIKEDEFYAEPDWAVLQNEWKKKAYPHLYKDVEKKAEVNEKNVFHHNDPENNVFSDNVISDTKNVETTDAQDEKTTLNSNIIENTKKKILFSKLFDRKKK